MRAKIILPVLALLVAGSAVGYWHWTQTPTYSLRQIQKAFETHDVDKFEKYVDIESVSSRLIDDVMRHASKESESKSGAEGLGAAFAAGLVQLMKPRLVEIIQEQVARLVEEGNIEMPGDEAGEATLQGISEKIGAGGQSFTGIRYTKQQGKVALIGIGFRNAQLDADLVLELKMRDRGSYWQLVEFSNLAELMEETKALEAARLTELNEPIRRQISETLRVERARKSTRTDRWGISKHVDLHVSVRNMSTRTITGFSANIRLLDPEGELVKQVPIRDADPITPSKVGGGVWSVDVNMFDPAEERLYEMPPKEIEFDVDFTQVSFEDGTELKLFKSLNNALKRALQ